MSIRTAVIAMLATLTTMTVSAGAQSVRWDVNAGRSAARWEVLPLWNQLRATTCPEDPAWRPGEGADRGRAPAWDALIRRQAKVPACTQAVSGTLTTADTSGWTGVRGSVTVRADKLVTGLGMRDKYARNVVLETHRYPEIRFDIDSLTGTSARDTLTGVARGTFELRGVRQVLQVPMRAWKDGSGMRVTAQFDIPARDLIEHYGMPRSALELAVRQGVWKSIQVAIELALTRQPDGVTAIR
jgi:hypothetical protein